MSDASSREGSIAVRTARELAGAAERWIDASRTGQVFGTLACRLDAAVDDSTLRMATAAIVAWTRSSWCYRWLTAEPDPQVIVIDLRETYTVGPIIRILDRLADPLANAWRPSGAASTVETVEDAPLRALGVVVAAAVLFELAATVAAGTATGAGVGYRLIALALAGLAIRERRSAAELAETRPGRALRTALEPPPAPDGRDEEGERREDREGESGRSDCDG